MANILIFDELTKRPLKYLQSVNTPDYSSRSDVLVNPDLTNIDLAFSKVSGDKLVNMTEAEKAEAISSERLAKYRELRQANYPPIGEQLDAILKQLNYMQMDGQTDLIGDLDTIVAAWLKVKRDFPKPEGSV